MATVNGAEMLGFGDQIGRLEKGRRADIVLIDLDRILQPYGNPRQNLFDVFLYRAKGSDVNTVMIDGEVVMRNRKFPQIGKTALSQRIKEQASREWTVQEKAFRETVQTLRKYLCTYYEKWYKEMNFDPYYLFNSKR